MAKIEGNGKGNKLFDTAGDDEIYGFGGDDRITVRSGNDSVAGGSGVDTLVIDYSRLTSNVFTLHALTSNPDEGGWNGSFGDYGQNNVTFTSIDRFDITGSAFADFITTTDSDGTAGGDDTVDGGGGNDVLTVGGGGDRVNGGVGNDVIDVGAGHDRADGGAGADSISADLSLIASSVDWDITIKKGWSDENHGFTHFESFGAITTGAGDDTIVSSRTGAAETISTGDGDDRVTVFNGLDKVFGGEGLDTLVIDYRNSTVRFQGADALAMNPDGGWNGYYSSTTGDGVTFSSIDRFEVTGSAYDDRITTADGADIINAGGGDDVVEAGSGDDRADGGGGFDGISADLSAIDGAVEWDITGNSFSGKDHAFTNFEYFLTVSTGSGDDVIVTSKAVTSTIAPAAGTISTAAGDDRVTLFHDGTVIGGKGVDTLVIDFSESGEALYKGAGPIANTDDGGWNGTFTDGRQDTIRYSSIDRFEIVGGSVSDTLTTAAGADIIHGGGGNDVVDAGGGGDVVDGGDGDDRIDGGSGADRLTGGAGADTLVGGGDRDTFVFQSLGDIAAGDRIADFDHKAGEQIDLSAVDADLTRDGVQHFTFIGRAAFSGAASDGYELRYAPAGGKGELVVQGDTDHDGVADVSFTVHASALVAADFILAPGAG